MLGEEEIYDKKIEDIEKTMAFLKRVEESDGFDVEHLMATKPTCCHISHSTIKSIQDTPTDISLLGKLGIHKYNFIQGTNLKLDCVDYFNSEFDTGNTSYHITLTAKDEADCSFLPFQTHVYIDGLLNPRPLVVDCDIARIKSQLPAGKPVQQGSPISSDCACSVCMLKPANCDGLIYPREWPKTFSDKTRYYTLQKSEYYDWLRLYMELAFIYANKTLKHPNLSKLEIVNATVETKGPVEPPSERLNALNAIFYIKYRYFGDNGQQIPMFLRRSPRRHLISRPRDRIGIVKRSVDKKFGHLSLEFDATLLKTFL